MLNNHCFCAMLDVSRNGGLLPVKVKEYIDILSKMQYNALMLYTEDAYEVINEPLFGYKKKNMKNISNYIKISKIYLVCWRNVVLVRFCAKSNVCVGIDSFCNAYV